MDQFASWFVDNGGSISDRAQIVEDDDERRHYVRVRPGYNIPEGGTIISCPHTLTLSYRNIDDCDTKGNVSRINQSSLTQIVAMRLMLMEQYLLGEESFWWPYICTLPQPSQRQAIPDPATKKPTKPASKQPFHTPHYFDNEDMLWLNGTNLGSAVKQRASTWAEEFEEVTDAIKGLDESKQGLWTSDLYVWAATVITSRSFSASALQIPGLDSPILIPGVDLLNHSLSAKVTWDWGTSSCSIHNNESLADGNEIFNNYGPKSNEELLMGYGFCLESNQADSFNLSYTPALSQHIEAVKALRNDSGHPRYQNERASPSLKAPNAEGIQIPSNRRTEETPLKDMRFVIFENDDYKFCPGFLADCSLALQNVRERHQDITCSQSTMGFSNSKLSRNKLHTLSSIIMILQQKREEIRKHDRSLPSTPRNKNQEYASIYRSSQLNILEGVLGSLSVTLHSITQLKLGSQPRIIHLADILTKSPKALRTHFREVIHAGVRTRDVNKIIERGGIKFAFAIWLCGLRLLHQSGHLTTTDPALDQWIRFLCKHYDKQTITKYAHSDGPAGNDSLSPASELDAEELADTVPSYINAIQTAVERHPESMYNDDWVRDQVNLTWCIIVVREEGVRCPTVAGGGIAGGEEEDEFVLVIDFDHESEQGLRGESNGEAGRSMMQD